MQHRVDDVLGVWAFGRESLRNALDHSSLDSFEVVVAAEYDLLTTETQSHRVRCQRDVLDLAVTLHSRDEMVRHFEGWHDFADAKLIERRHKNPLSHFPKVVKLIFDDNLQHHFETFLQFGEALATCFGADKLTKNDDNLWTHLIDSFQQFLHGNLLSQLIKLDLTEHNQRRLGSNNLILGFERLGLQLLAELHIITKVILVFECKANGLVLQKRRLLYGVKLKDAVVEGSFGQYDL